MSVTNRGDKPPFADAPLIGRLSTNIGKPSSTIIDDGYDLYAEPGSSEWNWFNNYVSAAVLHCLIYGIAEWDIAETYPINAYINRNGIIYKSRVGGNVGNSPESSSTQWHDIRKPLEIPITVSGTSNPQSQFHEVLKVSTAGSIALSIGAGLFDGQIIAIEVSGGGNCTVSASGTDSQLVETGYRYTLRWNGTSYMKNVYQGKAVLDFLTTAGLTSNGPTIMNGGVSAIILKANGAGISIGGQVRDISDTLLFGFGYRSESDSIRLQAYTKDLGIYTADGLQQSYAHGGGSTIEKTLLVKGGATIGNGTAESILAINSLATEYGRIPFRKAGSNRFQIVHGSADDGYFSLQRYNTSGVYIEQVFNINQATGEVTFKGDFNIIAGASGDGDLSIDGVLTVNDFVQAVGEALWGGGDVTGAVLFGIFAPYILNIGDKLRVQGGIRNTTVGSTLFSISHVERTGSSVINIYGWDIYGALSSEVLTSLSTVIFNNGFSY